MNNISQVTRRDIIDSIIAESITWNGRLNEPDFLARLFDLKSMPSTDQRYKDAYGDIWQHRINNFDWDEYWIFSDLRFNLMHCDDSIFISFLCEMVHPIVRADTMEVARLVQLFNQYLNKDNFEIIEKTRISERPVYSGRQRLLTGTSMKAHKDIINVLSDEYVLKQIALLEQSVEASPELAIGTAKELIETICQTILSERGIKVDKTWDLLQLLKQTTRLLQLTPEGIADEVKASKTIKSILGSLGTVVQGISELRNQYGSGHGKKSTFKGLTSRHAKLAVNAASTLAIFLLETHLMRK